MRPDVFFETLTPAHRPLVAWYLARGNRVFVFDFTYRLRGQAWLRPLFDAGRVTRIYVYHCRAGAEAIAAADLLWERFAHHPLARAMARIYGAEEAAPVLKWALLVSTFRFFFMRHWLEEHRDGGGRGRRIVLVSEAFAAWHRAVEVDPALVSGRLDFVEVPRLPRVWTALVAAGGKMARTWRQCAKNAALLGLVWLGRRWRSRDEAPTLVVDHVYAVDQPSQVKFRGGRGFAFLLDGRLLTAANTAFLVHPSADGRWVEEARAAGYRVVRRRDHGGWRSLLERPPRTPSLGLLARAVLFAAIRLDSPAWLSAAANVGVDVALREAKLLERVRFVNYVYTNQDDIVRRWQNAVVRRFGRQSWNFLLSMSAGYVLGEGEDHDHWLWAHQNSDHLVAQSRQMLAYQQRHRQVIRHYYSVGNIWSESVAETARRQGEALRRQWFGNRATTGKVVAWFDTTFVEAEGSPSTLSDGIEWYAEIEALLDEDPGLLAVIKPSKDERYFTDPAFQWYHPLGRQVVEAWERLRRHPRVYFAGHETDPAWVIAASDLTVTCVLSSCTAEALGAGKRALWYAPAHWWKGTLYDVDPLLFAHGGQELRVALHRLLYAMDDEEYRAWLTHRVRGLVEDFLDGRGLTRFRALLAAGADEKRLRRP